MLRLAWLDGDVKSESTGYGIFKNGGILAQHRASREGQGALTLDTKGVLTALRACVDGQRPDQLDGSEFFVTSNVMRLYKNLLQDKTNDMAFVTLVDGKPEYYFEGYKINELRHVSNAAKVDGNNDAFIAFTPKGNIQIALESSAPSIAPFIQDAKSRNYYSNTVFAADAMLVTPEFMQLWLHASA